VPQLKTSIELGRPKKIVAIPCLNEAQFISSIVTRARRYVDEVIVVDDGSTDDTALAAGKAGATVIVHKSRQGAGAATRTAFQAAKRDDADVLVTLDGDGQHDPDEIPQIMGPVLCEEADLVIGSRFICSDVKDVPRYRKFGIDVITWLYNIGSKTKVTDSQSGFRAYSRSLVEEINITETGFGFSVQTLIQARKKGFVIKEVPVSCIYHADGSTINPISHGLGVAFSFIKLRLLSAFSSGKKKAAVRDEPKE
jgi:glycosyltransferase involved in cell wall biosynthesis